MRLGYEEQWQKMQIEREKTEGELRRIREEQEAEIQRLREENEREFARRSAENNEQDDEVESQLVEHILHSESQLEDLNQVKTKLVGDFACHAMLEHR